MPRDKRLQDAEGQLTTRCCMDTMRFRLISCEAGRQVKRYVTYKRYNETTILHFNGLNM